MCPAVGDANLNNSGSKGFHAVPEHAFGCIPPLPRDSDEDIVVHVPTHSRFRTSAIHCASDRTDEADSRPFIRLLAADIQNDGQCSSYSRKSETDARKLKDVVEFGDRVVVLSGEEEVDEEHAEEGEVDAV